MRTKILLLTFLTVISKSLLAQMPDSVKNYVDSALYFMQTKSLNGKDLDWQQIRDTVYQKAAGAKTYNEAFPAIAYGFRHLKDYHGMLAGADSFYRYPPPVNFEDVLSPGIKKEFRKGQRIVTAFPGDHVAYLRIPGMNVTRQEDMDLQANKLRDSLCMLLEKNPAGIIIDLRMNTGGNSAPMLSGIGPLFQGKLLGYGVDRDGKFLEATRLEDGVVLDEKGNKMVNIKNSCGLQRVIPIAVLIGPSTVSSGEILAAFLKQQANVQLFGEATPGFCNATEGFSFANGNGYLLLSVNRIADAQRHVYDELLVRPGVYVKAADDYSNLPADPTVKAALDWLHSRKAN
ncbi:MAG: S41 family peptidase [Flavisolibacter sp.]